MLAQYPEYLIVEPRRMAELERESEPPRQRGEKLVKPRQILLEIRRQLKQQRTQAAFQSFGCFQELGHRARHALEPFDMRDPLRRLENKLELGRDVGRPSFENGRLRYAAKRVVDLDGL